MEAGDLMGIETLREWGEVVGGGAEDRSRDVTGGRVCGDGVVLGAAGKQTGEETGESEGGDLEEAETGACGRQVGHERGSRRCRMREAYGGASRTTMPPSGESSFGLCRLSDAGRNGMRVE